MIPCENCILLSICKALKDKDNSFAFVRTLMERCPLFLEYIYSLASLPRKRSLRTLPSEFIDIFGTEFRTHLYFI
jgi:hypothetical protein